MFKMESKNIFQNNLKSINLKSECKNLQIIINYCNWMFRIHNSKYLGGGDCFYVLKKKFISKIKKEKCGKEKVLQESSIIIVE